MPWGPCPFGGTNKLFLRRKNMSTPPIYQWKKDCEIRIEEIKEELRQLESYPETPELRKQIEDLESELVSEYESLEDYKGRIQLYESELYED
jgi:chromosome segregation ATPase